MANINNIYVTVKAEKSFYNNCVLLAMYIYIFWDSITRTKSPKLDLLNRPRCLCIHNGSSQLWLVKAWERIMTKSSI